MWSAEVRNALRAGFLEELDRGGDVPAAARRVGVSRSLGYRWAAEAGVRSRANKGRPAHPGKAEYDRLRGRGTSRPVAAARAGVDRRTAARWDRRMRARDDDQAGAATEVPVAALEAQLHPRFLTVRDRERIADGLALGEGVRQLARALGRAPSTVSREVRHRSGPDGVYRPYQAHRAWAASRPRPKTPKLTRPGPLRDTVQAGLERHWSPEQVSRTLVKEHPDDPSLRVSPETVYQALYLQGRGGLRRELATALRTGRTRRAPHRAADRRTPRVPDMVMISERPAEVADRAVPGHWEGDLVVGAGNKSAIVTLVERSTRYVLLGHLPGRHTAEDVLAVLVPLVSTLPRHLRGSLTWDQGREMAAHRRFTVATDVPVYFCDPRSPWQRGSNENTNGLLRQYFPKGTDLSVHTPEDLEHVAQELNSRPRKTLDWDTPAQRLSKLLTTA